MFPPIPTHLAHFLRSTRNITFVGFGIASIAGLTSYLMTRKRITPAERERARRDYLAHNGRITDGSITETQWIAAAGTEPGNTVATDTPSLLLYRYQIAGVTYECAQDVSLLPDHVCHVRVDLPIQVRFDQRNPANSIVVAEAWSGLRLATSTSLPVVPPVQHEQPKPERPAHEHSHA